MLNWALRGTMILALVAGGVSISQAQTLDVTAANGHAGTALADKDWAFVDKYCGTCHNATDWAGGVAFETLDRDNAGADGEVWEEAIRRLRGHLMPPPGEPQPDAAARKSMITSLESTLDRAAAINVNPGSVVLHRLNRPEYRNAVRELLDLEINAESLLPRDDQSSGFDNVAEVLKVTPSFLEQYLSAARQVSIAALGNPKARTQSTVYAGSAAALQYTQHEGLPLGTRGGLVIPHDFPADGQYEVTVSGLVGGGYVWGVMDPFTLIITVDDERVFQAQVGRDEDLRAIDVEQAVGLGAIDGRFRNVKIRVPAGRHRIGISYKQKTAAEHNEVLHGFVPVVGMGQMVNGNSGGPRISNVEIKGPFEVSGVSDTPSRRKLFVCRPTLPAEERPCASKILGTLAKRAFRRPVAEADIAGAMAFYEEGRKQGSFDDGIQKGVMAILASPRFLYRSHTPPANVKPGDVFALSDLDLATRLAFFLWSAPPDETLIDMAASGQLRTGTALETQVRRMLKDPRAKALATNFAGQWLNVGGLDLVNPDTNLFPDYTDDLIPAFRNELFEFVWSIFGEDRSVLQLLTADYSFLNERLALHYGVRGVRGGTFRKVVMPESARRGLLGKGALLMATSYANRTSPVVRGTYVLEHLMGTPPSSPPPGVEAFPESQEGGEQLTVRARLAQHRAAKSCAACHGVIDPVGMSLENFNALGQWRAKDVDAGQKIDADGKLADGTPVSGVDALRDFLVSRPDLFVQTLTENLLTYALGRSAQHFDMPLVRKLVRDAAQKDYQFSSLVLGIVMSPAFQTDRMPEAKVEPAKVAVR
jgi:mono/diheme cytochrome c family protein